MAALVKASLTLVLIPLAGKQTPPHLTRAGEYNCSALTTVLILVALSFSDLSVTVKELEITFVDLFLSPDFFSFAEILSVLESH